MKDDNVKVGVVRLMDVINVKEVGEMRDEMGIEYKVYNGSGLEIMWDRFFDDVKDKVFNGVRSWDWCLLNKNEEVDNEEWIRRSLYGSGLNFNYKEGVKEGEFLSSESLFDWLKDGYKEEGLEKLNMVELRKEVYRDIKRFDRKWSVYGLERSLMVKEFWEEMNKVYNRGVGDKCWKKVVLNKMMLSDKGFDIWEEDKWGLVCVDYNWMCCLKYLDVVEFDENELNDKEVVDELRKMVYGIGMKIIKESGWNYSKVDGLMFMGGRKVRKEMGDKWGVVLVNGEINY